MANSRRVAMMLDLDWPYARHIGVFAGTQRYALETGNWALRGGRDRPRVCCAPTAKRKPTYDGIIARATERLVAERSAAACRW